MDRQIIATGVFVVAAMTAILSFFLSFVSARLARRLGALDQPDGDRKIHVKPTPLFGGTGVAVSILAAVVLLYVNGLLQNISARQVLGFAIAVLILLIGGITDDKRARPPLLQIIFPILAATVVIISGTGIQQVTNLSAGGGFSLVWWKSPAFITSHYAISLPADLITLLWLLFATYATKLLDGLDGLVAGIAVIGSAMVGALTLSPAYFQPAVALLSGGIGGAFLGFLPRNINPAKQFLGEAGSTLAGFSLGFLAIVSSAKVAIALSVLAIPLADAAFVVLGRLRRGVSPWKGDATHLHFRLLQSGIPHGTTVVLLWGACLSAGVIALSLQTRGKIFLVATLAVATAMSSWLIGRYGKR
ncbi:undecaprenyl/decaprenyl-phosphate alpha-N-acetylglucosaminyl 1-phosphate transferase [Patescibacteria group bacterium]|nr:undecaprenyl/decaprenyl-phosphate alpha-N-acetylglucosaminyl 1-phosphate transferase [Patescibacteria group bacterium]MBU1034381.1 undecaprenyl/decaprenyl-phosphate alpha-N-acetylglucosaminyl 1-phosphate transferase [Patescibacteria group bacterium]MBU1629765.1 undecaprenyl/decaprenyl-phosphate alpha-N-acetylglucosaminyl 1-phosphate transferase [Patescibacteria group bacterium]MBU1907927.1 undecaprenyl/decaprenyl-phosphate alpha-N-acetylglucosaminyl 1-phosphate transferase [Patescibacteria gr